MIIFWELHRQQKKQRLYFENETKKQASKQTDRQTEEHLSLNPITSSRKEEIKDKLILSDVETNITKHS